MTDFKPFGFTIRPDEPGYIAFISATSGKPTPWPLLSDEELALDAVEVLESKIADLIAQLDNMSNETRLAATVRALTCIREADTMLTGLMEEQPE